MARWTARACPGCPRSGRSFSRAHRQKSRKMRLRSVPWSTSNPYCASSITSSENSGRTSPSTRESGSLPELKLYGVSGSDPESLVDEEVRPLFSEDVIDDAQYGFDVDHETLRKRIFRDFWRCARENERPERGRPGQALAVQRAIADIYEDTGDVETVS